MPNKLQSRKKFFLIFLMEKPYYTLKKFKENNLTKVNCLKLQTQENILKCFHDLISCQKRCQFLPIKIAMKKVSGNNVDISTIEITSKKVRGKNVDISTSEISSKKVHGNNVDVLTGEITSKKVRGKTSIFGPTKF